MAAQPEKLKVRGWEVKQQAKDLRENWSDNNFKKAYKPHRKGRKELDAEIPDTLHPELHANPRVSIEKFENNTFKRGLLEDETPFPVIAKLGPHIVS